MELGIWVKNVMVTTGGFSGSVERLWTAIVGLQMHRYGKYHITYWLIICNTFAKTLRNILRPYLARHHRKNFASIESIAVLWS